MPENKLTDIADILKKSLLSTKTGFRLWLLIMQISLFVSLLSLFLQFSFGGALGLLGMILSFALTAPLYAVLYTSSLRIVNENFQTDHLYEGYKKFFPVLGVASVESIFFFLLIFPVNTYFSYLVIESGVSMENLQPSALMDEKKLEELKAAFTVIFKENIWDLILLTLPVWPAYAWVRGRLFSAYYFVIEKNLPMGLAIVESFKLSKKDSPKIAMLVLITDILFPVFILLFFFTYPLKYAIHGWILKQLLQDQNSSSIPMESPFASSKMKNPYLS